MENKEATQLEVISSFEYLPVELIVLVRKILAIFNFVFFSS